VRGGSRFCQSPKGGGSGVFLLKHFFGKKIPKFPRPPPPPPQKKNHLPLKKRGKKILKKKGFEGIFFVFFFGG